MQQAGYTTGTVGKHHCVVWPKFEPTLSTDDARARLGRKRNNSNRNLRETYSTADSNSVHSARASLPMFGKAESRSTHQEPPLLASGLAPTRRFGELPAQNRTHRPGRVRQRSGDKFHEIEADTLGTGKLDFIAELQPYSRRRSWLSQVIAVHRSAARQLFMPVI